MTWEVNVSKQPMVDIQFRDIQEEEAKLLDSLVQVARSRGAVHAAVTKELNGRWRFRAEFTDDTVKEQPDFCRYLSDALGGIDIESVDEHGRKIGTWPGRARN
jgi:hypothetical protein